MRQFLAGIAVAVVGVLALIGAGTVVVVGTAAHHDFDYRTRHYWTVSAPPISPTARKLAGKISPRLKELAEEYEPDFVRNAGGLVARSACRVVYPHVVKEIPTACEAGVNDLLDHLGGMTIREVATELAEHARFKGHPVDSTVAEMAH